MSIALHIPVKESMKELKVFLKSSRTTATRQTERQLVKAAIRNWRFSGYMKCSFFIQTFAQVDSFVHRNRQLLIAAKR